MSRAARGYTMIEVMMSLAVLGLGALGIVALQRVTVAGNVTARNVSTANAVAITWLERLRTDAAQWNVEGTGGDIAGTRWLKQITTNLDKWVVPTEVAGYGSPHASILGSDVFATDTTSTRAFCTQVRYSMPLGKTNVMRVQVRVFWSKRGNPMTAAVCNDTSLVLPQTTCTGTACYGVVQAATELLTNVPAI